MSTMNKKLPGEKEMRADVSFFAKAIDLIAVVEDDGDTLIDADRMKQLARQLIARIEAWEETQ